ncbi:MAG: hypothetical protein R6U78_13975 [Bacteroidales bacterium]
MKTERNRIPGNREDPEIELLEQMIENYMDQIIILKQIHDSKERLRNLVSPANRSWRYYQRK